MAHSKRPRRLNYAVNKKSVKGGNKIEKAIKHFKKLQKREEVEGKTAWIENAFKFVLAKFKKYGINPNKV